MDEKNKRIIKNTFFLYIRMLLLIVVNFYTVRVVLQNLGVENYGLYNVVGGFVSMIAFLNQSMTNSIQRFMNYEIGRGEQNDVKKYFETALLTQGLISLFVLISLETVGLWFLNTYMSIPEGSKLAANIVFQFSILSLLLKIIEAPFAAVIIAKERMGFYAVISLIEAFGQMVIAFAIVIVQNKLESYSFMLLCLSCCILLSNIVYSRKLITGLGIRIKYHKEALKEVLSFSGWNLFGAASGTIKSQGINVLMNIFFGVVVNAARGVSFQVLGCLQRFVANFQVAINPQIVQSYAARDYDRYRSLTFSSAKISFALMWILTLPVVFCIGDLLALWLGEGNVPEYTDVFVKIILFTGLVDALGSSISVPLYATGKIRNYQIIVSSITIMVLPISYALYKIGYPPMASMYVSLILSIIAQLARVKIWANQTNNKFWLYIKEIIFPFLCVMSVSYLISYGVFYNLIEGANSYGKIIFIGFFTSIVNLLLIYLLVLSVNEKSFVKSKIYQKLHL